ncbi:hypothetical protein Poli38472_005578 [Pythium oligandrum]|uniref:Uncharacterized protein n=1 Tax=Pythium oligandrum TaxID=41045 RepID=A0A8K1CHS5_PYTOL|nr:hypothetical protein Poli38472_005578 [Pythium oligandrum]|eukprot:TMW62960.1 hypothetical protein Poli38472_005578 [Pythium oligandrum]
MMMLVRGAERDDMVVAESCPSPRDVDMLLPSVCPEIRRASSFRDETIATRRVATQQSEMEEKGENTNEAKDLETGLQEENVEDEDRGDGEEEDASEIMSFEEYNVADIDSLEIAPSQDFGGDVTRSKREEGSMLGSFQRHTCPWIDFRDGTQFQDDDESEVFDNVIYAPGARMPAGVHKPSQVKKESSFESSTCRSADTSPSGGSKATSPFSTTVNPSTEPKPPSPFTTKATEEPEDVPLWRQRLSVKRDCSFVDGSDFSVMSPRRRCTALVQELSLDCPLSRLASEEKIKLLDDECVPSSPLRQTSEVDDTPVDSTTIEGSPSSFFHRRIKAKRRKVRQLALDGFLQPRPCT